MKFSILKGLGALCWLGLFYSSATFALETCLAGNFYTPGDSCEVSKLGRPITISNDSNSDTLQAKSLGDDEYAIYAYFDDPTGEGAHACVEGKALQVTSYRVDGRLEQSVNLRYPNLETLPRGIEQINRKLYVCNANSNWVLDQ